MSRINFLIFLGLFLVHNIFGQRIVLDDDYHISAFEILALKIAAPIDTLTRKSSPINFLFFVNNTFIENNETFSKREKNGWFTSPLKKNLKTEKGVHTFFIQFNDGFIRGYNCFVTESLINATVQNLHERLKLNVSANTYYTLFKMLINKAQNTDSALLIRSLPVGLKAMVCIDFLGINGFDENDTAQCMITQYLFKQVPNGNSINNFFFRDFLGAEVSSPLYALLSSSYQMQSNSFNQNNLPDEKAIFSDKKNYDFIEHKNAGVNSKIRISYCDSNANFRRILIFIDN